LSIDMSTGDEENELEQLRADNERLKRELAKAKAALKEQMNFRRTDLVSMETFVSDLRNRLYAEEEKAAAGDGGNVQENDTVPAVDVAPTEECDDGSHLRDPEEPNLEDDNSPANEEDEEENRLESKEVAAGDEEAAKEDGHDAERVEDVVPTGRDDDGSHDREPAQQVLEDNKLEAYDGEEVEKADENKEDAVAPPVQAAPAVVTVQPPKNKKKDKKNKKKNTKSNNPGDEKAKREKDEEDEAVMKQYRLEWEAVEKEKELQQMQQALQAQLPRPVQPNPNVPPGMMVLMEVEPEPVRKTQIELTRADHPTYREKPAVYPLPLHLVDVVVDGRYGQPRIPVEDPLDMYPEGYELPPHLMPPDEEWTADETTDWMAWKRDMLKDLNDKKCVMCQECGIVILHYRQLVLHRCGRRHLEDSLRADATVRALIKATKIAFKEDIEKWTAEDKERKDAARAYYDQCKKEKKVFFPGYSDLHIMERSYSCLISVNFKIVQNLVLAAVAQRFMQQPLFSCSLMQTLQLAFFHIIREAKGTHVLSCEVCYCAFHTMTEYVHHMVSNNHTERVHDLHRARPDKSRPDRLFTYICNAYYVHSMMMEPMVNLEHVTIPTVHRVTTPYAPHELEEIMLKGREMLLELDRRAGEEKRAQDAQALGASLSPPLGDPASGAPPLETSPSQAPPTEAPPLDASSQQAPPTDSPPSEADPSQVGSKQEEKEKDEPPHSSHQGEKKKEEEKKKKEEEKKKKEEEKKKKEDE
ncbi:hypothetical protein PFISCL1PPCAC_23569, partial [Pristionchus fissidentatus]